MEKTLLLSILFIGLATVTMTRVFDSRDIEAYHFHIYFLELNPDRAREAMEFRKATRERIKDGSLGGCSLNEVMIGIDGPHPFSQYELCCNKTWFPQATAWHMKNHGNLSVLIHPLTTEDAEDHKCRASWLGQAVPMDTECSCLFHLLPEPRPCPVFPDYPDEIPTTRGSNFPEIQETEDYQTKWDPIYSMTNTSHLKNDYCSTIMYSEYMQSNIRLDTSSPFDFMNTCF